MYNKEDFKRVTKSRFLNQSGLIVEYMKYMQSTMLMESMYNGEDHVLHAGDELLVPKGTPHHGE